MDSTITQVSVPSDLAQRYADLGRQMGQSGESVMVEALAAFLAQREEDDARLDAAIAAADRGELVDAEVVRAENEAFLLQRGVTMEQLATIRAEIFAEMEEAYGVSLCE